jgi:hypothetical protein
MDNNADYNNNGGGCIILRLPTEILTKICSHLQSKDLMNCSLTCKTFLAVANPLLWVAPWSPYFNDWQRLPQIIQSGNINCPAPRKIDFFLGFLIKSLDFSDIHYVVGDDLLKALSPYMPNLSEIKINSPSRGLTDKGLVDIFNNCKKLSQITLIRCRNISDSAIISMANSLTALTEFYIEDNHNITDAGVGHLLIKQKKLKVLKLVRLQKITLCFSQRVSGSLSDLSLEDLDLVEEDRLFAFVKDVKRVDGPFTLQINNCANK